MFELLTVGTWLFWVLFVIFSIFAFACTESDNKGVLVVATIVFLGLFYKSWIKLDVSLKEVAIFAGSYIVIGSIWTIIKWWLHVKKVQLDIQSTAPSQYSSVREGFRRKLDPVQNKARITTWGIYWPWSMLWSAFHDIVDMAFQALLRQFRKISAGALKELDEKFPEQSR